MEETRHEETHHVRFHIDETRHESPTPTTGAALYVLGRVEPGLELLSIDARKCTGG
jgi:hypothetical protein